MHVPFSNFSDHSIAENVLIADPILRDGCFDRSVVYMVDHSAENGSLGLILNKPTPRTVGDLISSDQFKQLAHLPVYSGGPVAKDQLLFVNFKWEEPNTLSCEFQLSAETAAERITSPSNHVRAFVGHSAWSSGQLQDEIEKHAWYHRNAPARLILETADSQLWQDLLQDMSPFHHVVSLTPDNPFLN